MNYSQFPLSKTFTLKSRYTHLYVFGMSPTLLLLLR